MAPFCTRILAPLCVRITNFHAVRVAFTNLIRQVGGADAKESQELARHSTVELTINTYGRAQAERLRHVVEATSAAIFPDRALSVHSGPRGKNEETATAYDYKQLLTFSGIAF